MFRRTIRNTIKNLKLGFKNYCANSSLASLRYIVNDGLHYTERIFWAVCFAVSCFFSYYLINSYNQSFNENAITLVIEAVQPFEKTKFPSVGVCEIGFSSDIIESIEVLLYNEFSDNGTLEDEYDIAPFFRGITYPSGPIYLENCKYAEESTDPVMQCPKSGFKKFAEMIRLSCEKLMLNCKWQGKQFNCCHYFLPLTTSYGNCFMLNSIQTTEKNSIHWLNVDIGQDNQLNEMEIVFNRSVSVSIGNDDDIPSILLNRLNHIFSIKHKKVVFGFNLIDMVNDDGIEKINYINRKCKFPGEVISDLYRFHSFSACTTTCLRNEQLRKCNCSFYTYSTKVEHEANECDLNGVNCIFNENLLSPDRKILQPWRSDGLKCTCLPSCNEKQIRIVQKSLDVAKDDEYDFNRTIILKLQSFPTVKFRRQSVRDKLEIVVTIGGILSLFLGASILSAIEFLYFLIVRIFKIF